MLTTTHDKASSAKMVQQGHHKIIKAKNGHDNASTISNMATSHKQRKTKS
jgi:hypothetical protein